jgi:hypothetical protein
MIVRRQHQHRRLMPQHLGGAVTVSHVRDRTGEGDEAFVISWHSKNGDLGWLSPSITSEDIADAAATLLSEFTHGVKVKR